MQWGIQVQAVMPDMNPGNNDFPVAFVSITNCLVQHLIQGKASTPAPGIGYNTIRAEVVAAILDFQKSPGATGKMFNGEAG